MGEPPDADTTLALLRSLLHTAVLETLGAEAAAVFCRARELPRRFPSDSLPDVTCHAPLALFRLACSRPCGTAHDSAPLLARALLDAVPHDALSALCESVSVSSSGALLFTTRVAAACAELAPLRCGECRRVFSGRRALRNHAQSAHAASFSQGTLAVFAATRAASARAQTLEGVALHPTRQLASPLPPLLAAARDGDVALLSSLLSSLPPGCDVDSIVDRHGATALMWAAGSGGVSACELLVSGPGPLRDDNSRHDVSKSGADPLATQPRGGRTALHWAARHGRLELVEWLVGVSRVSPSLATGDGTQPLHLALWQGHAAVATYLAREIEAERAEVTGAVLQPPPPDLLGARCSPSLDAAVLSARARCWRDPNAYGCGPCHWAAMGGHLASLEWVQSQWSDDFLRMGVSLHGTHDVSKHHDMWRAGWCAANSGGALPLHKAAARGYAAAVAWLLSLPNDGGIRIDAGAFIWTEDADGHTPLELAALWGNGACAMMLASAMKARYPCSSGGGGGGNVDAEEAAEATVCDARRRAARLAEAAGHAALADALRAWGVAGVADEVCA